MKQKIKFVIEMEVSFDENEIVIDVIKDVCSDLILNNIPSMSEEHDFLIDKITIENAEM